MQNALAELLIIKICSFKKEKSEMEKRIETLENIIKSGNLKVEVIEKEDISNEEKEGENVETVENTGDIKNIESETENEDTENTEDIENTKDVEQPTENNDEIYEKIDLTPFKDVLKTTIFKKTVSKLFDESVKEIYFFPKRKFLTHRL